MRDGGLVVADTCVVGIVVIQDTLDYVASDV